MRRMSTFKDVIENTIKKNRIIKQITFSIEARERKNPPRRLKSPPPPPASEKVSSEEDNDVGDDSIDNTVNTTEISKIKPPRPLKHSASFYFSNDCDVSKSIPTCPPTPNRNASSCVVRM